MGFRFYAKRKAEELNIKGFVKNTDDGRVEVVAEGEDKAIQEFVRRCKKGPFMAKVETVRVEEEKPEGDLVGFDLFY